MTLKNRSGNTKINTWYHSLFAPGASAGRFIIKHRRHQDPIPNVVNVAAAKIDFSFSPNWSQAAETRIVSGLAPCSFMPRKAGVELAAKMMEKQLENFELILYSSPDGNTKVSVFYEDENFWLSQKKISELFGVEIPTINYHLKEIFSSGELHADSTIRKIRIVQREGTRDVSREIEFYNLDAIIAVGYRVNSYQATRFRIWATDTLKEFVIKGFVLDDERLKQGRHFGKDYFDELLERIREIRASERRFYQKITDLYALSADYDKDAPITKDFFATVQNKLHWAVTGKTAAELIYDSADAEKLYMGLTTWKNAPTGKILKTDIDTAKNYLSEEHIKELNGLVSAYLDLAENRTQRQILMKMQDWIGFLDQFLDLSNYPILKDKGKVSALKAKLKAEDEFEKYRKVQDKNYVSDFDRAVKRLTGKKKG